VECRGATGGGASLPGARILAGIDAPSAWETCLRSTVEAGLGL